MNQAEQSEINTASERSDESERAKEKKSTSERDFSKGECQNLLKYLIIEGFACGARIKSDLACLNRGSARERV